MNFQSQGGNTLNEEAQKNTMKPNIAKYTIKDSVFTDLFQIKKYLIQLYQALHPEDLSATENELTDVTIKNILTDNLYNDLGFLLGNRLLVLVEAQSTWTINIILRSLLYLAQTYHNYFERTNQSLYTHRRITLPTPELYVIYTGEQGNKPDIISLSKDFLDGADSAIDVKIKVIYERDTNDIVNQYIVFSKMYDEQRRLHGRTTKAVTETIRICKDRNILREYLETREKEVVSIMMSLYDEEEILRSYIRCECNEAAQEATLNNAKKTAIRLLARNEMSLEDIAEIADLPLEIVEALHVKIVQDRTKQELEA